MLHRPLIRQLGTFALVGACNALLDWAVYFLLLRTPLGGIGQLGKQLAKAGSFLVAVGSSYLMNRRWTFRSQEKAVARQAAKFFLVSCVGLALNNGIFFLLNADRWLGLPDLWSLVLATGLVAGWNFTVNKFWTFREVAL